MGNCGFYCCSTEIWGIKMNVNYYEFKNSNKKDMYDGLKSIALVSI